MTKQEIKDLIAAKIAGQGSAVDVGGALADILNALVDASGGGGVPEPVSGIEISAGGAAATTEQLAQIKSNCLAGQNIILSTRNIEYTVILHNGGLYVLDPGEDEEGQAVVRYWPFEEA